MNIRVKRLGSFVDPVLYFNNFNVLNNFSAANKKFVIMPITHG